MDLKSRRNMRCYVRYLFSYSRGHGFAFRYSHRSALGVEDAERTTLAVQGASGKRLLYRQPRRAARETHAACAASKVNCGLPEAGSVGVAIRAGVTIFAAGPQELLKKTFKFGTV
jgi:hypothetical protein